MLERISSSFIFGEIQFLYEQEQLICHKKIPDKCMASLLFWCSVCTEVNIFKTTLKEEISLIICVIKYRRGDGTGREGPQLSEFSIHVTIFGDTQKSVQVFSKLIAHLVLTSALVSISF